METQQNRKPVFRYAPLVFGILSILLSGIYQLQRTGNLQPHSADRLVQHHLDLIGGIAALLAFAGLILFFVLPKAYRECRIFKLGVIVCLIASVWGFLLLPL